MASRIKCIITSSVEGKGAYGITTETDEAVYFPVSIADAMDIQEFDELEAIVVRNDRPDPPYKAIKARRLDDEVNG